MRERRGHFGCNWTRSLTNGAAVSIMRECRAPRSRGPALTGRGLLTIKRWERGPCHDFGQQMGDPPVGRTG